MLRRRHMHERQAVIFGVLIAALAVIGLASAAVFTGRVDLGLFSRDFSAQPTPTPTVAPYPCPPSGALPVAYSDVLVNVYNATTQVGLAGDTAEALRTRGFTPGVADNAPAYSGVARVAFGPAGVAAAYTVAAQLPSAELVYDAREDGSVDLTLGSQFVGLTPADQVVLDATQPLPAPEGCTPFDAIQPTVAPPSAPTEPAETGAAG